MSARGILCTLLTAELCQSDCTGRLCRRPPMQVRDSSQHKPTPRCILQQPAPAALWTAAKGSWGQATTISGSAPSRQEKWFSNVWLCLGSSLAHTWRNELWGRSHAQAQPQHSPWNSDIHQGLSQLKLDYSTAVVRKTSWDQLTST